MMCHLQGVGTRFRMVFVQTGHSLNPVTQAYPVHLDPAMIDVDANGDFVLRGKRLNS